MSGDDLKAGCVTFLVLGILSMIGALVGVSFSKLGANEVGLDYSDVTKTLDTNKLYSSGVTFLGVGHRFIKFPTFVQEVDMRGSNEINARTQDGLIIDIQCRVLYRLIVDKNSLASLYMLFGEDYNSVFEIVTRTTVRDVASRFTAINFWTSRENITQTMLSELDGKLNDFGARIDQFLFTNFELPAAFQQMITQADAKKQEILSVASEKETILTQTETLVLNAKREVQKIELNANATATAILLAADAIVNRISLAVNAEVAAYELIQKQLGFTQQELIAYVWMDTLSQGSDSSTSISSLSNNNNSNNSNNNNQPTIKQTLNVPKPDIFNL